MSVASLNKALRQYIQNTNYHLALILQIEDVSDVRHVSMHRYNGTCSHIGYFSLL